MSQKVITTPPGFHTPMATMAAVSTGIPGCPPGLEYLLHIDQLLVKQQVELLEVLCGCEMNNKYKIKNTMGQDVYFAAEDTDFCTRYCCGTLRPFDIRITDNNGREILHFERPFRCQSCLYPCFLQEMTVISPQSNIILGYVKQEWTILTPKYVVQNANGEPVYKIEGPICTCRCCADVVFHIYNLDGVTEVGTIRKQWTGLIREAFTDADSFCVSFPLELDPTLKAVLLGALFLIDYMYFEYSSTGIGSS